METAKLLLRDAGMFSNVNEVVQQLFLAERHGYRFVVDWRASCYREKDRKKDPWNYYFEDCFPGIELSGETLRVLEHGESIACSRDNIITPREQDGICDPLLLPRNRDLPHRIIERYIRLHSQLRERISELVQKHLAGKVVGLHIRGPGRIGGGAPAFRKKFECKYGIPFERYFKFVDDYLQQNPDAKVFACSDSMLVIKEIMWRYGDKVFFYPATRSEFGEMHQVDHEWNAGLIFPKHKLGEDVIIETYMLSETAYFVHGNSNVVNFVLCKNPALRHTYVYDTEVAD